MDGTTGHKCSANTERSRKAEEPSVLPPAPAAAAPPPCAGSPHQQCTSRLPSPAGGAAQGILISATGVPAAYLAAASRQRRKHTRKPHDITAHRARSRLARSASASCTACSARLVADALGTVRKAQRLQGLGHVAQSRAHGGDQNSPGVAAQRILHYSRRAGQSRSQAQHAQACMHACMRTPTHLQAHGQDSATAKARKNCLALSRRVSMLSG